MTDNEKAARAIGYLEGFSAIIWTHVGEKVAEEYATFYDECVEVLRKTVLGNKEDE